MSEDLSEDFPEMPPTEGRRHNDARPARDRADESPRDRDGRLPQEHDEDRSPVDPNDWQEDWDRARWAP
ncbi:hypothetical protein [Nocardia aurantiaca]|uniref:Uncharacterized protein n=1 Tax=Nocardia aurantiaca TaxID=2675850 RepID=A0A6I3KW90_9NOCA|nr:hypothetical protein [Nocardia aurantiaca]MTE12735.1 hypothetical protein [Nocardia aurantiaca]